jgi:hypothetical protein
MLEELYTDWDGTVTYAVQKQLRSGQVFMKNEEPLETGYRPLYEARLDGVRGWVCEGPYKYTMHDIGRGHGGGCCTFTKEQMEFYEKLELPEGTVSGLDRFRLTQEELERLRDAPGTQMELFDEDTPGIAL